MREEATKDEFLQQLLSKSAGSAERLNSSTESADYDTSTPHRTTATPRKGFKAGHYEKVMHGVGVLGSMAGSIGLWWVGAFFTLRWIESLGLGASTNGTALWWLLPLTITAMEVGLQPGNVKRSVPV